MATFIIERSLAALLSREIRGSLVDELDEEVYTFAASSVAREIQGYDLDISVRVGTLTFKLDAVTLTVRLIETEKGG